MRFPRKGNGCRLQGRGSLILAPVSFSTMAFVSPSVAQARTLAEKLQKRTEMQLRTLEEERNMQMRRAEVAEEREREALRQGEAQMTERNRVGELLAAAQADSRSQATTVQRLDEQARQAQTEVLALQQRLEQSEARLTSVGREYEGVRNDKVGAQRELAVLQACGRAVFIHACL